MATEKEYEAGIGNKNVFHPVKSTGNEKPMNLLLQYKYTYKKDKEGKICQQRKLRLCAVGRSQERNSFVRETFAPVMSTFMMMMMAMTLGVQAGLQFIQFDWNMAFLNADNDRLEYAKPHPGYIQCRRELICSESIRGFTDSCIAHICGMNTCQKI